MTIIIIFLINYNDLFFRVGHKTVVDLLTLAAQVPSRKY